MYMIHTRIYAVEASLVVEQKPLTGGGMLIERI